MTGEDVIVDPATGTEFIRVWCGSQPAADWSLTKGELLPRRLRQVAERLEEPHDVHVGRPQPKFIPKS